MHEVALMQEVIQILHQSIQKENIERIQKVKLVVGQMTAAQPDSLQFAFAAISASEDWLKGAELEIEEKKALGRCTQCQTQAPIENYQFICPICRGGAHEIAAGRELYVDFYEGA